MPILHNELPPVSPVKYASSTSTRESLKKSQHHYPQHKQHLAWNDDGDNQKNDNYTDNLRTAIHLQHPPKKRIVPPSVIVSPSTTTSSTTTSTTISPQQHNNSTSPSLSPYTKSTTTATLSPKASHLLSGRHSKRTRISPDFIDNAIVTLDVGGQIFKTGLSTLRKYPHTRLASLVDGITESSETSINPIFLGKYFCS